MRHLATVAAIALSATLVGACTSNDDDSGSGGTKVEVSSTDDACTLSTSTVAAGKVTFDVTNDGSAATEFYLYESDGTTIVGEVENIGPGLTRDFSATVTAGTYVAACKPGMTGDGIRSNVTVTG